MPSKLTTEEWFNPLLSSKINKMKNFLTLFFLCVLTFSSSCQSEMISLKVPTYSVPLVTTSKFYPIESPIVLTDSTILFMINQKTPVIYNYKTGKYLSSFDFAQLNYLELLEKVHQTYEPEWNLIPITEDTNYHKNITLLVSFADRKKKELYFLTYLKAQFVTPRENTLSYAQLLIKTDFNLKIKEVITFDQEDYPKSFGPSLRYGFGIKDNLIYGQLSRKKSEADTGMVVKFKKFSKQKDQLDLLPIPYVGNLHDTYSSITFSHMWVDMRKNDLYVVTNNRNIYNVEKPTKPLLNFPEYINDTTFLQYYFFDHKLPDVVYCLFSNGYPDNRPIVNKLVAIDLKKNKIISEEINGIYDYKDLRNNMFYFMAYAGDNLLIMKNKNGELIFEVFERK
jgi:hypothetical protein